MRGRYKGPLGVLQLQVTPQILDNSLSNPETFDFPLLCRQVPGARVDNVVAGEAAMERAFVEAAKDVFNEGALAVTTNCGFTIRYQRAMAEAVPVPVAASSLLLLPYLASTIKGRIGVVTFDSRFLTLELLGLAGATSTDLVVAVGIEGSPTWEAMSRASNDYTVAQMTEDLLRTIRTLRAQYPDTAVLLFECAGFPVASRNIRAATGLPVFDAVTNANLLMNGLALSA